jgi:hypothetical protein
MESLSIQRFINNNFVRFVEPSFESLTSFVGFNDFSCSSRRLILTGDFSGNVDIIDVDKVMLVDNQSIVARDAVVSRVEQADQIRARKIQKVISRDTTGLFCAEDCELRLFDVSKTKLIWKKAVNECVVRAQVTTPHSFAPLLPPNTLRF